MIELQVRRTLVQHNILEQNKKAMEIHPLPLAFQPPETTFLLPAAPEPLRL